MFIRNLLFLLGIFIVLHGAHAQTHPVKLATGTRFDLMAEPAVGSIGNAAILKGDGSMQRINWIDVSDQPRSYTCNFTTIHFAWTEIVVQFTPQNSGTVQLSLMGPWEQSNETGNPIYKQEVLWDDLAATNSSIVNPGFESVTSGLPNGWSPTGQDAGVDSTPIDPAEGSRYARTWHNSAFRQSIPVTAGKPVTLRFFCRPQIPENFEDMKRIAGTDTPAHQARLKLMRGVNLGNYLEAPAGQNWGQTYDESDFEQIRAEGFDHVRLPVRWNDHTGPAPDFTIDPVFAEKVDFLVTNALNHDLAAIVNIHHFDAFTDDPAAQEDKFYQIWEQIAARYAGMPDTVFFELLNEPKDAATTTVINPIYAEAINRIRVTNPGRTILVGPGQFNSIDQLPALRLPDGDENLIVTLHSYDPFLFTHQGASWTGDATATTGIVYPGPPATPLQPAPAAAGIGWVADWINQYNSQPTAQNPSSKSAFVGSLELAKAWSDYYGRPIHVGEFGCYVQADPESRARFYRDMRTTMDELGIGWAMWDWSAGFRYWNKSANEPAPGMREAMFPKLSLLPNGPGAMRSLAAVGKALHVQRRLTLHPATPWQTLHSTNLTTPLFDFSDPNPPEDQAFYRLEWTR